MNAIRHEFQCENGHPWIALTLQNIKAPASVCPVCGRPPRLYAQAALLDKPLFRIEPSGQLDQRSGKITGSGYYFLVIQSPDLLKEICSRFPLSWDAAIDVAHDLKDQSFANAAKLFLRRADEAAGIHKELRAKIVR